MKVQILSNLFPLPWEPNRAAFNRQQFEFLARRDCDVRILVVVAWLSRIKNRTRLLPYVKHNLSVDYVSYFYVPLVARFSYPASLLCTLLTRLKTIRRFAPDCLLLSWAFPDAVAGTVISRLLKVPAIIKVHGSDVNMHMLYPSRAKQVLWAMERAAAVICVSRDLATKLENLGVDTGKIKVIYNGIDKSLFYPVSMARCRNELGLAETARIILYIGNLKPEKGCLDLVKAFARFAGDNPDTYLYYIGAGKSDAVIKKVAENVGLSDRVILLGSLPHDNIAKWLNACDLEVLPSYNEGVPNVLLEAMACGTPVVATNVGGIPEVVPEYAGLLVEPGEIDRLSDALQAALSRHWDSGKIANSVLDFTWENNSRQLLELMEKVSGR